MSKMNDADGDCSTEMMMDVLLPDTSGIFRGRSLELAQSLNDITNELSDYWPLTVRQAYYQAVSRGIISNNQNEYQRVSRSLTTLRREEIIPWEAYEDRSRRTVEKRGVSDLSTFIIGQCESFLDWRYYHRCRVQEQEVYVEVSVEKDALSSIFEEACWPYCVRLNVGRGQLSSDMIHNMAERFRAAKDKGQIAILLHYGDFDPTGIRIPDAIFRNLFLHHNISVSVRRAALTPEQIEEYDLPASIDAAKQTDPNYSYFVALYGDARPVEIDALHPKILRELIEQELHSVLDMSNFEQQMEIERMERDRLKEMRRKVMTFMREEFPAVMKGQDI